MITNVTFIVKEKQQFGPLVLTLYCLADYTEYLFPSVNTGEIYKC